MHKNIKAIKMRAKGLAIHGSHVDEAKSALAQWAEEVAK